MAEAAKPKEPEAKLQRQQGRQRERAGTETVEEREAGAEQWKSGWPDYNDSESTETATFIPHITCSHLCMALNLRSLFHITISTTFYSYLAPIRTTAHACKRMSGPCYSLRLAPRCFKHLPSNHSVQ